VSPDVVLSPGLVLLAPRLALQGALSYESTVSFHPGRGAPGAGQQRQGARREGLSSLQERDLRSKGRDSSQEVMDMCECARERGGEERDLHVDILRGQCEIVQVVVSRCVSIRVQTGGEVTAGHRDAHHAVADTCGDTAAWPFSNLRVSSLFAFGFEHIIIHITQLFYERVSYPNSSWARYSFLNPLLLHIQ